MLPIPNANRLLEWAWTAPWNRLFRFVTNDGARGHARDTIDQLTRVFERRRWEEENRVRRELASQEKLTSRSDTGRHCTDPTRSRASRRTLEELRSLDPYEFEQLVADLFNAQGFAATAVGGTADGGVDVVIRKRADEIWAIAQCKRYGTNNSVSAKEIRDFGGAFMLSKAQYGFCFTTSVLTRHARKTARGFPWLTVYNGHQLLAYIEQIAQRLKDAQTPAGAGHDDRNNAT